MSKIRKIDRPNEMYPNLILANSPVAVEIIDMLPDGAPTRCPVRPSWMGRVPATSADMTAGYDAVFEGVHAAVRDEDFAMLPRCGDGVRHGQHEHTIIGRNEIGVQQRTPESASRWITAAGRARRGHGQLRELDRNARSRW
jgi:Ring hydroxylating alpha subunit (catalytic domain)